MHALFRSPSVPQPHVFLGIVVVDGCCVLVGQVMKVDVAQPATLRVIAGRVGRLETAKNTKRSSARIAKLAAERLQDSKASQVAKNLAASALSQRSGSKQTGSQMEGVAVRALPNDRSAEATKELADSVLVQANRQG
jgi:hypothetical protein